jgi:hypothetical protein
MCYVAAEAATHKASRHVAWRGEKYFGGSRGALLAAPLFALSEFSARNGKQIPRSRCSLGMTTLVAALHTR